jgi:hypothetical protein
MNLPDSPYDYPVQDKDTENVSLAWHLRWLRSTSLESYDLLVRSSCLAGPRDS